MKLWRREPGEGHGERGGRKKGEAVSAERRSELIATQNIEEDSKDGSDTAGENHSSGRTGG